MALQTDEKKTAAVPSRRAAISGEDFRQTMMGRSKPTFGG